MLCLSPLPKGVPKQPTPPKTAVLPFLREIPIRRGVFSPYQKGGLVCGAGVVSFFFPPQILVPRRQDYFALLLRKTAERQFQAFLVRFVVLYHFQFLHHALNRLSQSQDEAEHSKNPLYTIKSVFAA